VKYAPLAGRGSLIFYPLWCRLWFYDCLRQGRS